MKNITIILIASFMMLFVHGMAVAGGPYGTPQPISRAGGGLHTAIGYWYQEDKFKDQASFVTKQHQLYSEAGYGDGNYWDFYARVGLSTLKGLDVFGSANPGTTTSGADFSESWKFFSTVGVKGFYPFSKMLGLGAFLQGTYYFSDFTDTVSGTRNGAPYTMELGMKGMWDVHAGIGLQLTVPYGVKLYMGPCLYYAEMKASPSVNIQGLPFSAGDVTLKNTTNLGGYAGIDIPLPKGFRLQAEGRYSEKLSAGLAVAYSY
jgi:hypothetical protein